MPRLTLLALLVALLVSSGCAGLYQGADEMYDQIRVQTDATPEDAYRTAARSLLTAGYTLDETNESLLAATTAYRPVYPPSALRLTKPQVRVSFVVTEQTPATVVYRATLRGTADTEENVDVIKRTMAPQYFQDAWAKLEAAAATYPGGTAAPAVEQ